jgi:hypothetical protein
MVIHAIPHVFPAEETGSVPVEGARDKGRYYVSRPVGSWRLDACHQEEKTER